MKNLVLVIVDYNLSQRADVGDVEYRVVECPTIRLSLAILIHASIVR